MVCRGLCVDVRGRDKRQTDRGEEAMHHLHLSE